jgi:hypothetical protein
VYVQLSEPRLGRLSGKQLKETTGPSAASVKEDVSTVNATYRIGNIDVAFQMETADRRAATACRVVCDCLETLRSPNSGEPHLEFRFVDRLPGFEGEGFARQGGIRIGEGRRHFAGEAPSRNEGDSHIQIDERLWRYDLSAKCDASPREPHLAGSIPARSSQRLKVLVAAEQEGMFEQRWRDLKKSWRYLHMFGRRASLHRVRGFCFSGYVPMLQLALMNHASTLCHSSAVERDGRVILFPAWGGVGKTGLMSQYVGQGWNFLADDVCVLQSDGRASIHPLPLHIYKYHEQQCGDLVDRMLRKSTPLDRKLWRFFGRWKQPHKMVRWVKPAHVFGEDRLSRGGKVAKAFYLHRTQASDAYRHEPLDPAELATRMASNVFDEIDKPPELAVAVRSYRAIDFIPDVGQMYAQIRNACLAALGGATCYSVSIPQKATARQTHAYITGQRLVEAA